MPTIDETLTQVGREQHGLKWERGTFSLTPVWTVDPCIQVIKDICYELLGQPYPRILGDIETKVEFLDEVPSIAFTGLTRLQRPRPHQMRN
jgi:hypothetical protein